MQAMHYKAYRPRPFTPEERDKVTILFGGLTCKHERLMQGAVERAGYRIEPLPQIERQDLDIGKEYIDVGACCPTTFTAGNLARTLQHIRDTQGETAVKDNYIFVTVGACGPCRFGQYHESYERVLEGLNLTQFRLFLLDLLNLDQSAPGGGLRIDMPTTLRLFYACFMADIITDMEYAIRPYEVIQGQTDGVVRDSVEILYRALKNSPVKGKKWGTLLWHVFTDYFVKVMEEAKRLWDEIEVDRLRVKPKVKITGEFWLQTHEGDGNYNIKRWLEKEGAEVIPPPVAVWMDYLMHMKLFKLEDTKEITKNYYLKKLIISLFIKTFHRVYNRLRKAFNNIPNPLPSQRELKKLAKPYFHYRLGGGEGHMLIGKAIYAYKKKQAHMVCELSPYGCLPNTMSVGAMAKVIGDYPDLLYAPIEIKGDAEVHALSRCQMILTEAKRRAKEEFYQALERTGLTEEKIREFEEENPRIRRATYRIPHYGYAGTSANYVMLVAKLMGRRL